MRPNTRKHLLAVADAVVEFSTLGEYRVMVEIAATGDPTLELWNEPITWSSPPARTPRSECTLPRAHDRGKALAMVG